MTYIMFVLLLFFVLGLAAVASNPSPYYGAFGLAMVAVFGCGVLLYYGSSFLSLVLLLVYLGGMLVVFGYSSAFSADRYPKNWANFTVLMYFVGYALMMVMSAWAVAGEWEWYASWTSFWVPGDEGNARESIFRGENVGVGLMYGSGVAALVICGLSLVLTLFVVMELVQRLGRGSGRSN